MSRRVFDHVTRIQPAMNAIYFNASLDVQFVTNALRPVLAADDFIRRHFEIYARIMGRDGGPRQTKTVTVQRSDYMVNEDPEQVMQVSA